MNETWQRLAARFDALMVRERVLVLVAAIVGIALVYDTLAIRPLEMRRKGLEQQLAESRQQLKTLTVAMTARAAAADPEASKRSYRESLRRQLAELDRNMQAVQRGVVPPERMAKLLEEILASSRGLQLESLRTLPAQRIDTPATAPAAKPGDKGARPVPGQPGRAIYQHSFEISLRGSYADLHDYLARLEKMPWQMFWARISVNTEQYPRLQVALTVQTLSLSKAWLIV